MRDTDEVDAAFLFILASLLVSLSQKRVSSSSKRLCLYAGGREKKKTFSYFSTEKSTSPILNSDTHI